MQGTQMQPFATQPVISCNGTQFPSHLKMQTLNPKYNILTSLGAKKNSKTMTFLIYKHLSIYGETLEVLPVPEGSNKIQPVFVHEGMRKWADPELCYHSMYDSFG